MHIKNLLPVFLLCTLTAGAQSPRKPNVLFIISDDLTTTALSCYENKACQTPNIDRLAAEGIRFTRAYSQFPVCGPSRASLMFGYYPDATKTYGYVSGRDAVGPGRKSWAQLFKDNGYYTARVSKIYHMGHSGWRPGCCPAGETKYPIPPAPPPSDTDRSAPITNGTRRPAFPEP